MPYFNDEMTKIKLCVLYMMKALDATVTAPQLTTALMESAELLYFDIQLAISELEDNALIASVPCAYGTGFNLTSKGGEALEITKMTLPRSVRDNCDEYVRSNRLKILQSEQFSAHSKKNPAGGYDVILTSFDKDRMLCSVVLNVADAAMCDKMCGRWKDRSPDIYGLLFNELLKD